MGQLKQPGVAGGPRASTPGWPRATAQQHMLDPGHAPVPDAPYFSSTPWLPGPPGPAAGSTQPSGQPEAPTLPRQLRNHNVWGPSKPQTPDCRLPELGPQIWSRLAWGDPRNMDPRRAARKWKRRRVRGKGCSVRTALVARPGRTTRRLTRALVGRPKEVLRGPPTHRAPPTLLATFLQPGQALCQARDWSLRPHQGPQTSGRPSPSWSWL